MAEPVLYSFRRCPYAMRARMALRIGGASYEHREVVLRDKPAEMLEVSPKGTVPVLVAGPGEVIEESRDIMRWALARSDPEGWLDMPGEGHALGVVPGARGDDPLRPLLLPLRNFRFLCVIQSYGKFNKYEAK